MKNNNTTDIRETFEIRLGRWLRAQLALAGLTPNEAADALGWPAEKVRRHLRGVSMMTVEQYVEWLELFDLAPATGLEPATYRSTSRDAA